jgi:hypothetical protein
MAFATSGVRTETRNAEERADLMTTGETAASEHRPVCPHPAQARPGQA